MPISSLLLKKVYISFSVTVLTLCDSPENSFYPCINPALTFDTSHYLYVQFHMLQRTQFDEMGRCSFAVFVAFRMCYHVPY
jgi:hypothetical protein